MGTSPPPSDDEREIEELIEQEEAFEDVSDIAAGEPIPPEMIPVIEAGGGVSEGFELAEAELIENATDGPLDGTRRIFDDAPGPRPSRTARPTARPTRRSRRTPRASPSPGRPRRSRRGARPR